ncbi:sulfite exporter TauE/SafE family protein, partial [Candidatus Woesearchaeota archaeon]|nr:sulfite exporter TauE/SafE family protein [Candidatus Woesearchaeota archaeon]
MIFELALGIGITIAIIAFFAEYIDSTLGMGYGTILTPLLLLFGFNPLQVVPAVLLSELITGLLAGFTHHKAGNVNFK